MKKKISLFSLVFVFIALIAISFLQKTYFESGINWGLLSIVLVLILLGIVFLNFERKEISTKKITLLATLATLAGVARIPFVMIPGVQPATFIIMISGYVFGVESGFIVGALAPLISNFFVGQGPWTPWQMLTFGLAGASAGLLGKNKEKYQEIKFLALIFIWGFIYGWIMNLWHWLTFVYELSIETFIATYLASFTVDSMHAIGNLVFAIIFGRVFYRILQRFKAKTEVRYVNNKN